MYPLRREALPGITFNVATDAGSRRTAQFSQNSFTGLVYIVLRLTLVVATASLTSIKFPGSAAQAFDFIGIQENGVDRVLLDPRVALYMGQLRAMSGLTSTRMTLLTAGTYNLVETIPLWLASPMQLNPYETAFREKNPTAPTYFFAQLSATAAANIGIVGGGTVTVTAASMSVTQVHNPNQKTAPWYQPWIQQRAFPVPGTNAQLQCSLTTARSVGAMIISTESSTGWQSDILNNIRICSDVRQYIGPQMMSWEDFGRMGEDYFGGACYVPNPAGNYSGAANQTKPTAAAIDFCNHGQLSTLIDPNETNLRLEADCQPSATGTSSIIRVTTLEFDRDLTLYSGPGGAARQVCNPDTPPWILALPKTA